MHRPLASSLPLGKRRHVTTADTSVQGKVAEDKILAEISRITTQLRGLAEATQVQQGRRMASKSRARSKSGGIDASQTASKREVERLPLPPAATTEMDLRRLFRGDLDQQDISAVTALKSQLASENKRRSLGEAERTALMLLRATLSAGSGAAENSAAVLAAAASAAAAATKAAAAVTPTAVRTPAAFRAVNRGPIHHSAGFPVGASRTGGVGGRTAAYTQASRHFGHDDDSDDSSEDPRGGEKAVVTAVQEMTKREVRRQLDSVLGKSKSPAVTAATRAGAGTAARPIFPGTAAKTRLTGGISDAELSAAISRSLGIDVELEGIADVAAAAPGGAALPTDGSLTSSTVSAFSSLRLPRIPPVPTAPSLAPHVFSGGPETGQVAAPSQRRPATDPSSSVSAAFARSTVRLRPGLTIQDGFSSRSSSPSERSQSVSSASLSAASSRRRHSLDSGSSSSSPSKRRSKHRHRQTSRSRPRRRQGSRGRADTGRTRPTATRGSEEPTATAHRHERSSVSRNHREDGVQTSPLSFTDASAPVPGLHLLTESQRRLLLATLRKRHATDAGEGLSEGVASPDEDRDAEFSSLRKNIRLSDGNTPKRRRSAGSVGGKRARSFVLKRRASAVATVGAEALLASAANTTAVEGGTAGTITLSDLEVQRASRQEAEKVPSLQTTADASGVGRTSPAGRSAPGAADQDQAGQHSLSLSQVVSPGRISTNPLRNARNADTRDDSSFDQSGAAAISAARRIAASRGVSPAHQRSLDGATIDEASGSASSFSNSARRPELPLGASPPVDAIAAASPAATEQLRAEVKEVRRLLQGLHERFEDVREAVVAGTIARTAGRTAQRGRRRSRNQEADEDASSSSSVSWHSASVSVTARASSLAQAFESVAAGTNAAWSGRSEEAASSSLLLPVASATEKFEPSEEEAASSCLAVKKGDRVVLTHGGGERLTSAPASERQAEANVWLYVSLLDAARQWRSMATTPSVSADPGQEASLVAVSGYVPSSYLRPLKGLLYDQGSDRVVRAVAQRQSKVGKRGKTPSAAGLRRVVSSSSGSSASAVSGAIVDGQPMRSTQNPLQRHAEFTTVNETIASAGAPRSATSTGAAAVRKADAVASVAVQVSPPPVAPGSPPPISPRTIGRVRNGGDISTCSDDSSVPPPPPPYSPPGSEHGDQDAGIDLQNRRIGLVQERDSGTSSQSAAADQHMVDRQKGAERIHARRDVAYDYHRQKAPVPDSERNRLPQEPYRQTEPFTFPDRHHHGDANPESSRAESGTSGFIPLLSPPSLSATSYRLPSLPPPPPATEALNQSLRSHHYATSDELAAEADGSVSPIRVEREQVGRGGLRRLQARNAERTGRPDRSASSATQHQPGISSILPAHLHSSQSSDLQYMERRNGTGNGPLAALRRIFSSPRRVQDDTAAASPRLVIQKRAASPSKLLGKVGLSTFTRGQVFAGAAPGTAGPSDAVGTASAFAPTAASMRIQNAAASAATSARRRVVTRPAGAPALRRNVRQAPSSEHGHDGKSEAETASTARPQEVSPTRPHLALPSASGGDAPVGQARKAVSFSYRTGQSSANTSPTAAAAPSSSSPASSSHLGSSFSFTGNVLGTEPRNSSSPPYPGVAGAGASSSSVPAGPSALAAESATPASSRLAEALQAASAALEAASSVAHNRRTPGFYARSVADGSEKQGDATSPTVGRQVLPLRNRSISPSGPRLSPVGASTSLRTPNFQVTTPLAALPPASFLMSPGAAAVLASAPSIRM